MSQVAPERLADFFVQVADTLVDEFDLIEFLHMVTSHTSQLVQATAAGLLLADARGRLQLMAASDERAEMLELFQVQALEGPGEQAYRTAAIVATPDLEAAVDRWPSFVPTALDAGFRSVHAFPMQLRGNVLGALSVVGTQVSPIDEPDLRIVQALADIATIGLLQQRAIRRSEELNQQLQAALDTRIVIEQAKGALAQIHGGSPDDGFDMLRAYCRRHNLKLTSVARAVIQDPASVPELTSPQP